ncbi:MAG: response regulator transcription factor [Bacteroidetes bacterium]|nr:response regulator transcription factor [Bacteroidota bacterium]MCL5739122.1 response regulator transcription factor [Bacteroidota bacterium]
MKILVVEDEKKVARFLKLGLEAEDHQVDNAYDGEAGERMALSGQYDVIVLDIMLPKKNGIEVLRSIRSSGSATPVLILTAKGSLEDKVEGLDKGADDYLVKPFAFAEFIARVRSLGRRIGAEKSTTLKVADLELDTLTRKAKRGGKEIELTNREYALLEYFVRNVNRVLTRTVISEHIWEYNFDTGTNIVEVYVNKLRNKIDSDSEKKLIHTVRGAGYMMKID